MGPTSSRCGTAHKSLLLAAGSLMDPQSIDEIDDGYGICLKDLPPDLTTESLREYLHQYSEQIILIQFLPKKLTRPHTRQESCLVFFNSRRPVQELASLPPIHEINGQFVNLHPADRTKLLRITARGRLTPEQETLIQNRIATFGATQPFARDSRLFAAKTKEWILSFESRPAASRAWNKLRKEGDQINCNVLCFRDSLRSDFTYSLATVRDLYLKMKAVFVTKYKAYRLELHVDNRKLKGHAHAYFTQDLDGEMLTYQCVEAYQNDPAEFTFPLFTTTRDGSTVEVILKCNVHLDDRQVKLPIHRPKQPLSTPILLSPQSSAFPAPSRSYTNGPTSQSISSGDNLLTQAHSKSSDPSSPVRINFIPHLSNPLVSTSPPPLFQPAIKPSPMATQPPEFSPLKKNSAPPLISTLPRVNQHHLTAKVKQPPIKTSYTPKPTKPLTQIPLAQSKQDHTDDLQQPIDRFLSQASPFYSPQPFHHDQGLITDYLSSPAQKTQPYLEQPFSLLGESTSPPLDDDQLSNHFISFTGRSSSSRLDSRYRNSPSINSLSSDAKDSYSSLSTTTPHKTTTHHSTFSFSEEKDQSRAPGSHLGRPSFSPH
ncbi:hypothetical protein BLNAU_1234 [Blattamonas nauphoetae]|uniref:RRM domain-containing protein n=1 Tax=Blattamonas nauphoetae TaxID=2049346 RepID=A0ABQ9YIU1_9EUKA|nr:hypothetical protein BLNAU_1234 [Blattamonas nauphoetae]